MDREQQPQPQQTPLGAPLPTDEHACSVSLPTWSSVVGYEEGDRTITRALKTGYPRFVYHPYVVQLMDYVVDRYGRVPQQQQQQQQHKQKKNPPADATGTSSSSAAAANEQAPQLQQQPLEDCLLLPTADAAARCQAFLQQALENGTPLDNAWINPATVAAAHGAAAANGSSLSSRIRHVPVLVEHDDENLSDGSAAAPSADSTTGCWVHAVLFPAETAAGAEAKAYWQHTGEVVSSRRAERALHALNVEVQERVTCPVQPQVFHSAFPTTTFGSNSSNSSASTTTTRCGSDMDAVDATTTTTTTTDSSYNPVRELRARIADWAGLPRESATETTSNTIPAMDHVFLTPSGMASIYHALRSTRRYRMTMTTTSNNNSNSGNKEYNSGASGSAGAAAGNGGTSIVYGFPYLDTLKVCSRPELCPGGVEFFGCGDASDLAKLEQLLEKSRRDRPPFHESSSAAAALQKRYYCGLFTEVPSNPLLQCPDLHRLRELADEYDFCLVVDDTISNFLNVDVLSTGLADAVCTSLTKIVSGRGDAIAGSIVTNPHTVRGRWMQQDLMAQQQQQPNNNNHDNNFGLYCQDAHAILCNSADFVERNAVINETAEELADWLAEQPDVQTVFYPKHSCAATYDRLMRQSTSVSSFSSTPHKAGYGGLMSILLHPHMCQRLFYDSLNVAKGPSLGTNFTLVCPYTLLAHYHELDFALSYNVPPNLLRISVGLEPVSQLKEIFGTALAQSRLYPKPSIPLQGANNINNRTRTTLAMPLSTRSYSTTTATFGAVTANGGATSEYSWSLSGYGGASTRTASAVARPATTFAERIQTSRCYQAHHTLRRLTALIR